MYKINQIKTHGNIIQISFLNFFRCDEKHCSENNTTCVVLPSIINAVVMLQSLPLYFSISLTTIRVIGCLYMYNSLDITSQLNIRYLPVI